MTLKRTTVKSLPFRKAVIDDIKTDGRYMTFKVVSDNHYGKRFKIYKPYNREWLDSDAYTRSHPLAVKVIIKEVTRLGKTIIKGELHPDYAD